MLSTLIKDIATEAPIKLNTKDTVVEVGNPNVLNRSSRSTSEYIRARKITKTSNKVNISGLNIPDLATSIIPLEKKTPKNIPKAATVIATLNFAALEPKAEFRKLIASFATPTFKSTAASNNNNITIKRFKSNDIKIHNDLIIFSKI